MDSEGSSFQEQVSRLTKNGALAINNAVRCANNFPKGNTWQSYNAYEAFQSITNRTSKTVLNFANAILAAEGISNNLYRFDDNKQVENLIIANDNFLETIKFNEDVFEGRKEIAAMHSRKKIRRRYRNLADPLVNPILACSKDIPPMSAKIRHILGLKKPQVDFTTPINNDNCVFRPKLLCKPNSLDSNWTLEEYEYNGIMLIKNPYEKEIDSWKPTEDLVKLAPPPFSQPPGLDDTKYTYIDTKEGVNKLVKHLNTVKAIAVDLENHSLRCYQGLTCLIQITTDEGGDFLIDAIKLRDDLQGLNEPFTNGNIIKVFHGADWDIEWLQRDHNVYVVGLFDTYRAARLLNQRPAGLKDLMQRYVGIQMDKTHQLSDWRVRPLPEDMIKYARLDTHYLLYIWRCMWRDLYMDNKNALNAYMNSAQICKRTYKKPIINEDSWYNCYIKIPKINFDEKRRKCFRLLHQWRDCLARTEDESPGFLMPNKILSEVAKHLPQDKNALLKILALDREVPMCVRKHLDEILTIINTTLNADESVNNIEGVPKLLTPNTNGDGTHLENIDCSESKHFSTDIGKKISISLHKKTYSAAIEAYNLLSSTYSAHLPDKALEFVPPYKRLMLTADYYEKEGKQPEPPCMKVKPESTK